MAIYNGGYPASYQNPYQQQMQMQQYQQQQMQQHMQQPRFIEVLPVDAEDEVSRAQVSAGGTALFAARNNRFLATKSVELTGETSVDFYDLRPPAPPTPKFDPADYVTKDELTALVAELRKEREHEPV